MSARSPSKRNVPINESFPTASGISFHALVTLPPFGTGQRQTLFDLGNESWGVGIALTAQDELEFFVRPLHGDPAWIAMGGVFGAKIPEQYVHLGIQVRINGSGNRFHGFLQGKEIATSVSTGRLGEKLEGTILIGSGRNDISPAMRLYVKEVAMWDSFIDIETLTGFIQHYKEKYGDVMEPIEEVA